MTDQQLAPWVALLAYLVAMLTWSFSQRWVKRQVERFRRDQEFWETVEANRRCL